MKPSGLRKQKCKISSRDEKLQVALVSLLHFGLILRLTYSISPKVH